MSEVFTFATEEENAVWQVIHAINNSWTQGDAEALNEHFHEKMIAITPMDRLRRDGKTACVEGWKKFIATTDVLSWREIDPIIRVYGDAAVVSYYYESRFAVGEHEFTQSGRDLFYLARENGKWLVVADQFSAYS